MAPNLFDFATQELSQDAFLCWLLYWAHADHALSDPPLHRAGRIFLNALLAKHDRGPVDVPRVKKPQRQVAYADIVVAVDDQWVLLIEDKVGAREHDNQLGRCGDAITALFPDREILRTFVKTGDQSSYVAVESAGYKRFLREDFLKALREGRSGVTNAIFVDFLSNLERWDSSIESYATARVEDWTNDWDPWVGFYKRMQQHRNDLDWDYVANPSGGFNGAWWHARTWNGCPVYLIIKQGPLCFNITVDDKERCRDVRAGWHKRVMAAGQRLGLRVRRPDRFGYGYDMTAALVEASEWMMGNGEGKLDIDQTMKNVELAERVLDEAITMSEMASEEGKLDIDQTMK